MCYLNENCKVTNEQRFEQISLKSEVTKAEFRHSVDIYFLGLQKQSTRF